MVSGLGNMSYEDRLRELKLTTLENRRLEMDLVETYKIVSGISNVDPATWFVFSSGAAAGGPITRLAADPLNIKQPPARLEVRKNFFSVRVCEAWNKLPSEVKQCRNVGHFKNAIRKLLSSTPP